MGIHSIGVTVERGRNVGLGAIPPESDWWRTADYRSSECGSFGAIVHKRLEPSAIFPVWDM